MANIYLDHIVILVPHAEVLSPPSWLTKHFTITPGGQHAGGQTENKLICFKDGSYIELISFVDDSPEQRRGHRWGNKSYGIIDYALITDSSADENYTRIQARLAAAGLDSDFKYEPPEAGGRQRDDGQVLKWNVTVPAEPTQRGELPFFCHDVTPRELRVPFSKDSITHPSGAYGISQLTVLVSEERVAGLVKAYAAVLDLPNPSKADGIFELTTLNREGTKPLPRLLVKKPVEEAQKEIIESEGLLLHDLVISASSNLHWSQLKE